MYIGAIICKRNKEWYILIHFCVKWSRLLDVSHATHFFSGAVDQDQGEKDDDDDNDDDDDDGIGNWKWIIPIIVLCVVIILLMIIMYACLRYKTLGEFNGQGPGMNETGFSI